MVPGRSACATMGPRNLLVGNKTKQLELGVSLQGKTVNGPKNHQAFLGVSISPAFQVEASLGVTLQSL